MHVQISIVTDEQIVSILSLMLMYRSGQISRSEYLKSCSASEEQLREIEARIDMMQRNIIKCIAAERN